MSAKGLPEALRGGDAALPSFAFPEQAAIAMAHACHYGRWRERPQGTTRRSRRPRGRGGGVIAGALGRGDEGWLAADEVERLLGCYGLRTARNERVATPEDAADAAGRIGGTVALKAFGPDIVHKTEVGAVRLGLDGRERGRGGRARDGRARGLRGPDPRRASSCRRWSAATASRCSSAWRTTRCSGRSSR